MEVSETVFSYDSSNVDDVSLGTVAVVNNSLILILIAWKFYKYSTVIFNAVEEETRLTLSSFQLDSIVSREVCESVMVHSAQTVYLACRCTNVVITVRCFESLCSLISSIPMEEHLLSQVGVSECRSILLKTCDSVSDSLGSSSERLLGWSWITFSRSKSSLTCSDSVGESLHACFCATFCFSDSTSVASLVECESLSPQSSCICCSCSFLDGCLVVVDNLNLDVRESISGSISNCEVECDRAHICWSTQILLIVNNTTSLGISSD